MLLKYLFRRDFYSFLRSHLSASYTRYQSHQVLRRTGKKIFIDDDVKLVSPHRISIGNNSRIGKGVYINSGHLDWYGSEGEVIIGENVVLAPYVILFAGVGRIEISNDCDLGCGVQVLPHSIDLTADHTKIKKHLKGEVKIGRACIIDSGSILLAGTDLGEFCHVAAGAVVQGRFPAYTTLVGNPARSIPRKGFIAGGFEL